MSAPVFPVVDDDLDFIRPYGPGSFDEDMGSDADRPVDLDDDGTDRESS